MGDFVGHPFRGNQYTSGGGDKSGQAYRDREAWAKSDMARARLLEEHDISRSKARSHYGHDLKLNRNTPGYHDGLAAAAAHRIMEADRLQHDALSAQTAMDTHKLREKAMILGGEAAGMLDALAKDRRETGRRESLAEAKAREMHEKGVRVVGDRETFFAKSGKGPYDGPGVVPKPIFDERGRVTNLGEMEKAARAQKDSGPTPRPGSEGVTVSRGDYRAAKKAKTPSARVDALLKIADKLAKANPNSPLGLNRKFGYGGK